MAKNIPELTAKTTPVPADLVEIYDSAGSANKKVTLESLVTAIIPSGIIADYGGGSAPSGWLLCDGSAISRTTYSSLFAAIGTTWGAGNGSTTFNLPDLRGRVRVTKSGSDTEFDTLAETTGSKTHTLSSAEMPTHTHTQDAHNHNIRVDTSGGWAANNPNSATRGASGFDAGEFSDRIGGEVGSSFNVAVTATNQNTGGGAAHNNIQPSVVVNSIIKI